MISIDDDATVTKIQKYFSQITKNEDGSIPADYPGLSFDEAVELHSLLYKCSKELAAESMEKIRNGVFMRA